MRKYYIALLTFFVAAVSHAEDTVEATVSALPPTVFFWDQPVRALALVLGVMLVLITFQQALFRKQPKQLAEIKVLKD